MKSITSSITKAGSIALLLFAVAACDSQGPMEEAGESIDETTSSMGNSMEDAGESIDETATDMGNAIEDKCEEAKEGMGAKDTDC